MWTSRLFWKVFLVYAGLNLTLAFGFLVITSHWQREQVLDQLRVRLHDVATLARGQITPQLLTTDDGSLQELAKSIKTNTGLRTTIIGDDGRVLADSEQDPSVLENHGQRPEILLAKTDGEGTAMRESPSLGLDMIYLALPIKNQDKLLGYVRVAEETTHIDRQIASIRHLFWWLAIVIGLVAVSLTYVVVGRIIRPIASVTGAAEAIARGESPEIVRAASDDEVGALSTAFSQMQQRLTRHVNDLRVGSERLGTVLGSMIEGVIAVDPNERILLANEASRVLLGFVTRDAVGRPLAEVVRSRVLQDAVLQALGEREPVSAEFDVPGATRRVIALRAVRLPGDPCPGVVVVLHDITELRRLENLRREFVANVSHELKTPLASIKAYAETLRLGGIDDPQHNMHFVTRIEEQAERLHQLILDLISLAQVESGREVFDITAVDLGEVVEDCLHQQQEAASLKNLDLLTEPPVAPVWALADEEGVRTILNNLVSNALKYTPAGGRVVVAWRKEADQVALEVRDTGIGIATRDQQRVFERFYRADKARSRELGGTGLGLSIVKHLAQAFGGNVGLESKLDEGSTFRVHLPLANAPVHGG
jgi:two-component system, OmpR family, phosphate regulon sensor histidine kinase PhoR